MSRSFTYLRRILFGTSCAIVFGFGATQASARDPEQVHTCPATGYYYPSELCVTLIGGGCVRAVCDPGGYCQCGDIP